VTAESVRERHTHGHLIDIGHHVPAQTSNWIQMALGTPVVLGAGWPFFVRGCALVKNRSLNMFSLIALGTGAAWLDSMVGTLARGLFPPELRSHGGAVAVYFEAAAVIAVLVLLGQVLELRAPLPGVARPVHATIVAQGAWT
jgi:Cu+-exporting ATPase